MHRALALTATLVLLLALLGTSLWLQRDSETHPPASIRLSTSPDCDAAQQACRTESVDLMLELQLGPPVTPLEPFSAVIRLTQGELGKQAQIELQFLMRGMEMGMNRYRLERQGDRWKGQVTLPVCTTGRVDWLAILTVRDGERLWHAEFPFTTQPSD